MKTEVIRHVKVQFGRTLGEFFLNISSDGKATLTLSSPGCVSEGMCIFYAEGLDYPRTRDRTKDELLKFAEHLKALAQTIGDLPT